MQQNVLLVCATPHLIKELNNIKPKYLLQKNILTGKFID